MEEGYLLLTGFLFFGLIIACTCQMYIWLANSYKYPTEPRAHSFIRGLLSIRLLRWQNLTELSTPSNFVCHPTPPPFVLHVLRGHIPRWYIKGNRKGLTLLTLIQLSLKSLPIHRWITEFTRRHVELNLNMFTIAMIFLCWPFCNFRK